MDMQSEADTTKVRAAAKGAVLLEHYDTMRGKSRVDGDARPEELMSDG